MGYNKKVVIVGARGLGKEIICYVEEHGSFQVICVLDEQKENEVLGYNIVHPSTYSHDCRNAIFAVGYPEHKQAILDKYSQLSLTWETFIHPSSTVSRRANLGDGVVVAPYSLIAGNAQVGSHVLVNAFSAIAHDCLIGDRSSLMPYACLNGGVSIGNDCLISTGAKVLPGVTIGDRCRVSAGSIVTRDVPADSLVFGNPAQHQVDIAMLVKARNKFKTQQIEPQRPSGVI